MQATPGRLLVIDDHENNRLLLQDILGLAGHEVLAASWVRPAWRCWKSSRSTSCCSTC